jgi:ubiquitin C-terminal hydrolase
MLQVLVVHIARFTYEEGQQGTVKVTCPVHHKTSLDLRREWFADNAPVKQAKYRLVAKVVHKGEHLPDCHASSRLLYTVLRHHFCIQRSIKCVKGWFEFAGERATNGHYITIARRCEQWRTCDDAMVLPASEEEVLQPNAYMLFYEMCR